MGNAEDDRIGKKNERVMKPDDVSVLRMLHTLRRLKLLTSYEIGYTRAYWGKDRPY